MFDGLVIVAVYPTDVFSAPTESIKHIGSVSVEADPEHITLTYRICDKVVTGALALEKSTNRGPEILTNWTLSRRYLFPFTVP